ncbi:hypothetical protein C9F11_37660 [Streptomyces sp. YIM 121038]|uniref:hypothetical protein n=1 Tax=Streptomyces sp. YIM 121038 TaxID=2136401 RepID=UPI001110A7C8|nr:hypothetical protein [Streptomyces sp. YIM 121038]QCX81115.1 hypothetical protein C9F11_37660 [Streptomyces sp. YIM 121038]
MSADFFQPGRTYTDSDRGTDWAFRVDHITTCPETGERAALGWRHFYGVWEPYAYHTDDWDLHQLVGHTEVTEGSEEKASASAATVTPDTPEPLLVSRFDVAIEPAPEEEPVLTIGAIAEDGRPVALLLDVETRAKVARWLGSTA